LAKKYKILKSNNIKKVPVLAGTFLII
jgi:hypothetical protein